MSTILRSTLNVNFRRDGAWYYDWSFISVGTPVTNPQNMVGTDYYITSSYAGGYWAGNPTPTVGDLYEAAFAVTDLTSTVVETTTGTNRIRRAIGGRYSITNGAAGYSSLSALRTVTLNFQDIEDDYVGTIPTATTKVTANAMMSVTATVRVAGGGTSSSGTMPNLTAQLRWEVGAGGAPGSGGGGGCVQRNSFVRVNQQAWQITPGDWIRAMEGHGNFQFMRVISNRNDRQPCRRITMKSGASLVVSESTPLYLKDGGITKVKDLTTGTLLPVFYDNDEFHDAPWWDSVDAIEEVGIQEVQCISVGGETYAAGESPGAYIYTHNVSDAKP